MKKFMSVLILTVVCVICVSAFGSAGDKPLASPYAKWKNGPSGDPDFFLLAVWLQEPAKAPRYKAAGFNTYVGLWQGPTEQQLAQLKKVGMKVVCEQNQVGLEHIDDPVIIGWLQMDEPDNAQRLPDGKGYGPPVTPEEIVRRYKKMHAADPSRPIQLGLGQGVAWDNWRGRGVRTNHPEDYPQYIKGGDIISFDIYPVVHNSPEVVDRLWYVARGVERLATWTEGKKIIWNAMECTRIGSKEGKKPTPHQLKCEIWMAIVHGSMGIIYFVHEWQPKFNESALLDDTEMLSAAARINRRITALAPVLNSPTVKDALSVASHNENAIVATMTKKYKGDTYIFVVGMRNEKTNATFAAAGIEGRKTVEVLGEERTITSENGIFTDTFEPWDVHLYKIDSKH